MNVKAGSTDVTTYFHLRLAADGTDATGLTITNFDLQYTRSGAAPSAKVDATALAATNSAHGDNQAIEIDATDQPGVYRVDWPDAAFAAGVREVILTVKVATAFTESLRVNLTAVAADVTHWLGTAAATPTVAGVPEVDLTHIAGSAVSTSTAQLGVNVVNAAGTAWGSGAITAAAIANGAIDAATFAADVDAEILSYLVDDATRIDASALNTATGTTIPAILDDTDLIDDGTSGLAKIATDVAAILVDTGTTLQGELDGIQADTEDIQSRLPAALVGGRIDATVDATGLESGALAAINAEVDTALADIHLDHLLATDYDPQAKPGAAGALLNEMVESDDASPGRARFTAGALEEAPTGGSAPTVGEIADAVWDEATSGHTTSGTFGEQLKTDVDAILVDTAEIGAAGAGLTEAGGDGDHLTAINLPNQTMDITGNITGNLSGSVGSVTGNVGGNVTGSVGSLATQAKADVNAEVDGAIETYHLDHLLAVDYDPQSKPGAAGALLNEMVESDDASPGRARFTAGALEEAPTGGSAPTAGEIADAVWDEATSGHTTSGTFGEQVKTDIDDILTDTGTTLQAELDGIQTDTEDIQSKIGTPAGASVSADVAAVKAQTAAIETDTQDLQTKIGTPAGASVSADIADVEGKVDDLESRLGTPSDLGSGATVAANLADIEGQTDDIGTAGAGLTALATQASVNTVDTVVDAIKAKTDSLTFTGAGRVDANVAAVNNSTTGVDKLSAHLPAVLTVVIGSGSSTTSIVLNVTTGINGGAPSSTNDFYNGAVIVFTSGALAGQRTDITDYVGSTVTLTVTALTGSPSAGDTAVIV